MKNSIYLFFFCILISFTAHAQIEDSTINIKEGWILFDTTDFSISYPDTWISKENSSKTIQFTITNPPSDSKDVLIKNISVGTDKFKEQNYSLKRYTELSVANIEKSLNKYKLISQESTTLNGMKCNRIDFLTKVGKMKLRFVQYYFIKNRKAYILNFTSTKKDFPLLIIEANEILENFSIK